MPTARQCIRPGPRNGRQRSARLRSPPRDRAPCRGRGQWQEHVAGLAPSQIELCDSLGTTTENRTAAGSLGSGACNVAGFKIEHAKARRNFRVEHAYLLALACSILK